MEDESRGLRINHAFENLREKLKPQEENQVDALIGHVRDMIDTKGTFIKGLSEDEYRMPEAEKVRALLQTIEKRDFSNKMKLLDFADDETKRKKKEKILILTGLIQRNLKELEKMVEDI
jgi:hypothetical protein